MLFYYKAKKVSGEETEGEKEAADEFELARILREQDFILIYFSEKNPRKNALFLFLESILNILTFETVPVSEKMIFSRNLAVMVHAGIPLSRGIETLLRQTQNKRLKQALQSIYEEIKKGKSFNEALANYPKIFSPIFTAMVKAGEKTGNLSESLNLLSLQLKKEYELKRRVKGALTYPIIVLIAMLTVGTLMMIYVVPTLILTFKELNVDLPVSTKIFIKISELLTHNGISILIFIILFTAFIFYISSKPRAKKFFNFLTLNMPLIAPLAKKINTARTARTLGSLVGSGVSILEALEVTQEVLQNVYYKNILKEARDKIEKGEQVSHIFSAYPKLYPPVMSEMTAVGEETGKISEMLHKIASFYESEVAAQTKNLSTIIEPLLMLVMGGAVGFFAISMLQPMYSMMQGI